MNEKLKMQVLAEMSRQNMNYIVNIVQDQQELIADLVEFSIQDDEPLNSRASWVLTHLADANIELLKPYLNLLAEKIDSHKNGAVKRNILRVLSVGEFSEEFHAKLIDLCFEIMISFNEKVAAKVHAMQVLFNLSQVYPDLKKELKLVIMEEIDKNSVGFKGRGLKLIKKMT